ncbi:hypothetical protein ACFX13_013674 [Malus domestica]|uniref:Prolamin-like domain-containing protein n=1 Tax=Malus domestica TaxID=3750 RepID=A0A498I7M7_MALDO|nr:uncharacterized protein LOC114823220 [Malus domestica]RXH78889.1 hypothetical protein DVH24_006959 [Malus domestica]
MASFGNLFVMAGLVLAAIIIMSSVGLSSAFRNIYENYDDRDESSLISPTSSSTEDGSSKDGPPPINFPDELLPNEELTKDCCANLVDIGYDCHQRLVKLILLEATFEGKASEALQKSSQMWNKRVKVVDQADSPSLVAASAF